MGITVKVIAFLFLALSTAAFAETEYDTRVMHLDETCKDAGQIFERTSEVSKKGVIKVNGKTMGKDVKIVFPLSFFKAHRYDPFDFMWHVKFEEKGKSTSMIISCESETSNIVNNVKLVHRENYDEDEDFDNTSPGMSNDEFIEMLTQIK